MKSLKNILKREEHFLRAISLIKSAKTIDITFLQEKLEIRSVEAKSIIDNLLDGGYISYEKSAYVVNQKLFYADEFIVTKTRNFPLFKLPIGYSSKKDLLKEIINNRLPDFYPNANLRIIERIEKELNFLCDNGLDNLFLVISDLLNTMRNSGFTALCVRGNIQGSIVAFVMGITKFDPIKFVLIFEEIFYATKTITLPEIIIEEPFEIIEFFLKEKYGGDKVVSNGHCVIVGKSTLSNFHIDTVEFEASRAGLLIIYPQAMYFKNDDFLELKDLTKNCPEPSDLEVFDFFATQNKHFLGIPYFQSKAKKEACKKLKPKSLSQLASILAFANEEKYKGIESIPDPNKHLFGVVDEFSKETYGKLIFREQKIKLLEHMWGVDYFSICSFDDNLFNIGEEKIIKIISERLQITAREVERIFLDIPFYRDLFNKSRFLGMALIAFNIAKLKLKLSYLDI